MLKIKDNVDLKEGMYVRLQNDVEDVVIISRIANVFDKTILTENDGSIYQGEYTKENVLKASHNIIDLIEVGDYVNGYKVIEIDEYKPIGCDLQKYLKVECCKLLNAFYQEDIKTIVTKEQFESMSYKLD